MGLVIRDAKRSDTDGLVGELSKGIFEGLDYFPGWLEGMWSEPGRKIWVCVDERGKIVGAETLKSVDGGVTAVPQSLRVLPEYRGQGVAKLLGRNLMEYATKEGGFKRLRTTTRQDNEASIRIHRKEGFAEVFKQGTYILHPVLSKGTVEGPDFDELAEEDPVVIAEVLMPLTGGILVAEWTSYSAESLEETVSSVKHAQQAGFTFIIDKANGAVSYFKFCDYPRGLTLMNTVLSHGDEAALMQHHLYYYNKGATACCHSVIGFYDINLFSTPTLPGHLAALQEVTEAPYDHEGFNLTSAGLTLLELCL
eukprot:TRINITY_DN22339_c0_g1_i1.p1 TRINITY_DN22339_c0_g1~~TRINITY_DN22339_c0_g1_i1.p1  ORF type:complete len:323 (+),score=103.10 TRINITY_DN22339_c0_g1_i1:43-969(+)